MRGRRTHGRGLGLLAMLAGLVAVPAAAAAAEGSDPATPVLSPSSPGPGREDLRFPCGPLRCAAWLYRPVGAEPRPPVVVMGHGFAGTRDLFLDRYAERFRARGLAVLVFDYRHFGDSEGEPRQLVDPELQLQDWRAALALARSRPDLDGERVALWGTSFSGGHVLVTAAQDPAVRAVTAQVPFVDAREGEGAGFLASLRAGWAIARDLGRRWTGRAPLYIPVIGRPGELAAITAPGSYEAIQALVPPQAGWRNEVAARSLWNVASYRPTRFASRIRAPLLLIAARRDSLVPLAAVARVASLAPDARLRVVEGGHFDGYSGERFEEVVAAQADFLAAHLLDPTADTASPAP